MSAPRAYYDGKIAAYTTRLGIVRKRLALLAALRLFCFISLCVTAFYLFPSLPLTVAIPAFLLLTGFIVLIKFYFRLTDQKALLEKLLFVNTNERALLDHQPNSFPDGKDQLDTDSYLDDLDIFGPRSLFHSSGDTARW